MPHCPRCHQSIATTAIACPHCRLELKAHGHPGIHLYRAEGETYLCRTCAYEADDSCTYPQRPYAKECTLYWDVNRSVSKTTPPPKKNLFQSFWNWNKS